ncbi:MAG: hybrid sensor histidine kinase/response regulator [Treponema sp.]|nr:hybrid sensor histidine kinase/response regulator [Treponema sp.]
MNHFIFSQGGGYSASRQVKNVSYSGIIYDATNGLPTSDANCLLCSKDGYIWIGGYSGIIRYDGSNFERISIGSGLTSGRAIFEDSKNRIWIGTNDNGVVLIDSDKTRHYTYKNGLLSSSIRSFAEDKYGNIFIGTTSGIAYVNSNGLLYHLHNSLINEEEISKLDSDSKGTIYGQTYNGIVFAIKDGMIKELYSNTDLDMSFISRIFADPLNPGKVYLCTDGGTIYYGDFGKKSSELKKIDVHPIKNIQWISYECDRIWISSSTQIGYLDKDDKFNIVQNLPLNSSIEMLTSDYQGNLWACSSAQGVMKVVTNNFVDITKDASLPKLTVNSTCLYNGLLYVGTEKGLYILDKDNRVIKNELTDYISDSRIRCIVKDKNNNIWIANYNNDKGLVCFTSDGKITSFTTKNGMPTNAIRNITIAKDNSIICGTQNGVVVIKNNKIEKIYSTEEGIRNKVILTVEEGENGKLYAGSNGDGIYVISDSGVKRLGRDEGLTSDVVMRIKNDKKHGVLWIVTSNSLQFLRNGTITNVSTFPYNNNYDLYLNNEDFFWVLASSGIYSVSASSLLSDNVIDYNLYSVANGLPSAIRANSYSALDENGNLFLCCREGVSSVNINNFFEQNSQIKTRINSIYCGNQKILPNEKGVYILPATNERIKLSASVLDYTMANPMVHFYLEGAKDDGITVNRNALSALEYNELAYGNYTLHIQILNHAKNQITLDNSFEIIKKPHVTELLFIRLLIISFLVIFVAFIVWRIMKSTIISKQYVQIQQAKEEAESANKTKSRFLANMSQEIITPINTIMCMDEMILREEAKGVPNSYFLSIVNYGMNIHDASQSLLNLINDLLELTKIESGKLTLNELEYDVQDLLRSIIVPIRQKSIEKDLKFNISIDQMIPKRLFGDVGKIKQILQNLLTNAIKYTDEGGFDLKISLETRTNDHCDLCIIVKDSGIGMTPEQIETIFDAYGAFEKNARGFQLKTGMGLDISRRFAEFMGGVLVCQSEEGKGSQFIFTLTQKIINPAPMGKFIEQYDMITRGPYYPQFIAPDADVLVASENVININLLNNLLKMTKVFITRATSRQELIDKIKGTSFNVAFIDQLIFEDNEEIVDDVISSIKKIDSNLPVYVFTENASFSEDYYKKKGFNGSLTFPVNYEVLELTIMRHLPLNMMELPDKNDIFEDLKEIPENLKWLYDVKEISVSDGLKNSSGIANFLFALNLFQDTIDQNIDFIDKAYKNGDFEVYRVRNGIIRTSARIIGALHLYDFSSKMEDAFKQNDKLFIAANTDKLLDEYRDFKDILKKIKDFPFPKYEN